MLKFWPLSLCLFLPFSNLFAAQPDLLQQLYGRPSPSKEAASNAQLPVSSSNSTPPTASSDNSSPLPVVNETLTLTFRSGFTVSRERMYLSDVATCRGLKRACDEINAIDIGAAPKPMRQERVTKIQVEAIIQKEFESAQVLWEGAESCLVTALSSPTNEEAVTRVIEKEFESAPKGMRVIIGSIRLPTMQVLRHNNYSYKIPNYSDQISRVFSNPRTRFAQIKVQAHDLDPSSQAVVEFIAQVNLRVEIQALVMTQTKERGERLSADSIALEWIPFQDQVVTDEKLLVGRLLRSRLMTKAAVRTWDLTREPEVLRGDRIEAVVNSGGVRLNSVAQALEPGFIGQKIRVRLETTKKTILAVVTARAQVEVPSL